MKFNMLKCGISTNTLRILPLSIEDKSLIKRQDRKKLKDCEEYSQLLVKIYEFKRSYTLAPIVNRQDIKDSYACELKEKCDAFRAVEHKYATKEVCM